MPTTLLLMRALMPMIKPGWLAMAWPASCLSMSVNSASSFCRSRPMREMLRKAKTLVLALRVS